LLHKKHLKITGYKLNEKIHDCTADVSVIYYIKEHNNNNLLLFSGINLEEAH